MNKTNVLFLCTGNSARSQMAEAFLRRYAGDHFEVSSAGLEPHGLNPYTTRVMQEVGLSLSGQWSKDVKEYMGKKHFGYLITVCSHADARCPTTFPGVGQRLRWSFDDPAAATGTDAEILQVFRAVRDQIDYQIKEWLAQQGLAAA